MRGLFLESLTQVEIQLFLYYLLFLLGIFLRLVVNLNENHLHSQLKIIFMKLNNKWYPVTFFSSLVLSTITVFMILNNIPGISLLLLLVLITTFAHMIIGIYEVNNSKKINSSQKLMWTLGFLFLNSITGIIYLFYGRKKILN